MIVAEAGAAAGSVAAIRAAAVGSAGLAAGILAVAERAAIGSD